MNPELLHHFQSKQQSIEERIAVGKDLRKKYPRINQGEYNVSPDRTDPVSILEEQGGRGCLSWYPFDMQECSSHLLLFYVGLQPSWRKT